MSHGNCREELKIARAQAVVHGVKVYEKMSTYSYEVGTHGRRVYREVWSGGNVVWHDLACCAYEARTNAILRLIQRKSEGR